jgi:hypothetical protein
LEVEMKGWKVFVLWLLLWYLPSAALTYGWAFAHFQGKFPSIAAEHYREDMGDSVQVAALAGVIGPVGIFIMYTGTGFAKYGWRLK